METFKQDDSGQWWCYTKRGRERAKVLTCCTCAKEFPCRHPQKYCSKKCAAHSRKGNRIGQRPCAWCDKMFVPKGRGNRKKCCSQRCAYDLGNLSRGRSGPKNPNWTGGKYTRPTGYVRVNIPGRGCVLEHRYVMEQMLGRRLESYEEVHHKNGIRNDNRPENLELWAKRQPGGQRVADLIEYAKWVLETYEPIKQMVRIAQ